MLTKDQKIAQDINKLIFSINPTASQSFQQNIKNYAKKVLGSYVARPMTQTSNQLKEKIMAKVSNTHDNKSVLQCQEAINRLMQSNNVQKKSEILKLLLKTSQLNNKSLSDFSGIFKDQKQNTLNQTQQSFHSVSQSMNVNQSSLSFLKSKRPSLNGDYLTGIRNRGSVDQGITQNDILKDITYALQNIQTNLIEYDSQREVFNLKPNINVSETVRRMASELSDIGWLYKRITTSIVEKGSITKALSLAIQKQLNEYYRWLAIIETTIKQKQLSLRKLILWSYEPLEKLKWLAIILDAVKPYSGCQIISVINSFRPQGSLVISQLLSRILSQLVQPLLQYIYHWVYKGELIDDFNQFFILQTKKVQESQEWHERYTMIQENIPNIIDRQSALMIFNAGKTIFFLKNHCEYSYFPTISFISQENIINKQIYESSNILSLNFNKWLKNVSDNVNQELVKVLFNHFDLKYHLQSMKYFYLMGKGDFIQHLIDSMKQEMEKPKHQIYEHTLDGYISDGITKCFTDFKLKKHQSKYFSEKIYNDNSYRSNIVDRVLAKKVDYGETAWDSFNFQYVLDRVQPLRTLLSHSTIMNYQKIFHVLWKVKRIEQILKEIWIGHLKDYPKNKVGGATEVSKILHNCHLLRASMCHFLTNLYGYLMIAIQSKWNQFIQNVQKAQSFDQIIKHHSDLQRQLLDLTLNTQNKKVRLQSLLTIFQIITRFKILQIKLQGEYNDYYEKCRLHQHRKTIADKSIMGLSIEEYQIPQFQGGRITKDLGEMKNLYDKAFKTFYQGLKKESENGSVLLFRLDFSEYYTFEYEQQEV